MPQTAPPSYGASDHYLGDKGKAYIAWQDGGTVFAGQIHAHKFERLIKPTDTVIDFGCGGGGLLYNLKCARKIGVDVNPAALERAKERGLECYTDAAQLPDGIADVIVSNHALEHVPHPTAALRELRTKLKPGGVLSLCVPIDNWRHQKRYDPADANHHLHTWTPQLLGNTLHDAGFEVVTIRARIHSWPKGWVVATYNRFPLWLFNLMCHVHGMFTGKGWEILAECRVRQQ